MSERTHRAAVTERAARAGGIVAEKTFRGELTVEHKSSATDLVTDADREAQSQVLATITQEFPSAQVVCEEEAAVGVGECTLLESVPESGDAWVVDPIDGTGDYVRGIGFWTTSVAAVTDGEPVAAATYMPGMGDIYTAGPESVSRNDQPMRVSDRTDPETFAVGLIGRWATGDPASHGRLVEGTTERFGDVRRFGSMQGVLALVAAGSLDAAIMPDPPEPWDSIAGVQLVRRAGGTATDLDGNRWVHDDDGLLVSNGEHHDRLCAVVSDCDTGPES